MRTFVKIILSLDRQSCDFALSPLAAPFFVLLLTPYDLQLAFLGLSVPVILIPETLHYIEVAIFPDDGDIGKADTVERSILDDTV